MKCYMFEDEGDQRLANRGADVSAAELERIGVLHWHFDGADALEQVNRIAAARGYKHRDEIQVSAQTMGDAYADKIKSFFDEHLHEDEEIRFIVEGDGYFDVRSQDDAWIRIAMEKGDLIILPPGIYHRFTPSEADYTRAMRLFKTEPKWTPLSRAAAVTDSNTYRQQYVQQYLAV